MALRTESFVSRQMQFAFENLDSASKRSTSSSRPWQRQFPLHITRATCRDHFTELKQAVCLTKCHSKDGRPRKSSGHFTFLSGSGTRKKRKPLEGAKNQRLSAGGRISSLTPNSSFGTPGCQADPSLSSISECTQPPVDFDHDQHWANSNSANPTTRRTLLASAALLLSTATILKSPLQSQAGSIVVSRIPSPEALELLDQASEAWGRGLDPTNLNRWTALAEACTAFDKLVALEPDRTEWREARGQVSRLFCLTNVLCEIQTNADRCCILSLGCGMFQTCKVSVVYEPGKRPEKFIASLFDLLQPNLKSSQNVVHVKSQDPNSAASCCRFLFVLLFILDTCVA
jgi:hypothetical protein